MRATPAREYLLVLALGAAGSGVALLALRQSWARVVTDAPAPLPSSSVSVTGAGLAPAAGALALAALATLAAVIATRGAGRRVIGAVLAAFGAGAAAAVSMRTSAAGALAAARAAPVSPAGAATTGGSSAPSATGGAPGVSAAAHVALASFPWQAVAVAGAVLVVAAGVLIAWRGARWPVMSSRYERPGAAGRPPAADSATMWESLSRGLDPTEADDLAPGTAR